MDIRNDSVVTIAYTLTDDGGNIIDSSQGQGDFAYLHGHENIVPGLEEALEGKSAGDRVSAAVEPEKAYGPRNEELVFSVPRSRMPDEVDLEVGMEFRAQSQDGQEMIVSVVGIEDDSVTLDGNHPLAGQRLNFEVDVKDVRAATPEEIDHGHVHGPGGHHHH